jgi:nitric oxide reductase activation protein
MAKKTISASHKESLKILSSDSSNKNHVDYDNRRIQVVLLKGLDRDRVFSGRYTFFDTEGTHRNRQAIVDGIRLGKQLARRLLFRNDERRTRFPRLQQGKIDKRLLHSVACGNDAIFYREKEESFSTVNFHISIDGSHSMQGNCFWQSLKTAVAIAQAAQLIKNFNVCISFRFHVTVEGSRLPLVLIAYDSKRDKLNQIKQFFPFLKASGPTPEGLCYPVISDYIEQTTGEKSENYFINFYDGMPGFVIDDQCCYEGKTAMEHVRDEVFRMKRNGIHVLSYYIVSEKWQVESIKTTFADCQYMYGKKAKMINVNDLGELAQSLNRLVVR